MTKKKASPRSATAIDVYIGSQIRRHRMKLGLSEPDLAQKIGVSLSQLQRYELGRSRVSAATLFDLCELFGVSLASMFERKLKA